MSNLKSITIPSTLLKCEGNFIDYYFPSLTKVNISNLANWFKIAFNSYAANPLCSGADLYYNGTLLTSIAIPSSITKINDYALYGCESISSITIPNTIESIGKYAFAECSAIQSMDLPTSVIELQDYAFQNCTSLTTININMPSSLTVFGNGVFDGCEKLQSPIYTASTFIKMPTSYSGSYTIPSGISSIVAEAFKDCSKLAEVTIPNTVITIGEGAFRGCSGLTSVTMPNSVTSIGNYAFRGCSGLISVTIPNSVKTIGQQAFDGCSGLTSVYVEWNNADKIPVLTSSWDFPYSTCDLYVPIGTKTIYQSKDCWNTFRNIIEETVSCTSVSLNEENKALTVGETFTLTATVFPEDATDKSVTWSSDNESVATVVDGVVTAISEGMATITATSNDGSDISASCNITVTAASIPNDQIWYTSMDGNIVNPNNEDAFNANIVSNAYTNGKWVITFDKNVTTIGEDAFKFCSGLAKVTIPKSVIEIGSGAFYYCQNLKCVELAEGLKRIEDGAFMYCPIKTISLPNSVSSVGNNVFFGNEDNISNPLYNNEIFAYLPKNYESYEIPEGIKNIAGSAFRSCSKLKNIILPSSMEVIGDDAFIYAGLTSVDIPASVKRIGCRAFQSGSISSVTVHWKNASELPYCDYDDDCGEWVWDIFETYETSKVPRETFIDATLHVPYGTKSIYETSTDGPWCYFNTIVEMEPEYIICASISLEPTTANITVGETMTLTATVLPEDAEDKSVTWSSDNESVATVVDGVVTAVAVGTANITAKTNDGSNLSATCAVTVNPKTINVASIAITPNTANLKVGDAETLTLTILPEDATDKSVTWSSDNESVATVVDGMVTAVAVGTANITAKTNDGSNLSATCVVTVTSKEAPSEDIEPTTDISKFTNVLYINDVEARQGTELSLPLNMKNAEENITAFECKVYLPEGVEWASTIDKRGNKIFVQPTFNEERTDANYHTINSIKQMEDGGYYVIVYSDKKEIILDKDGAILYMPLTVSEEIEPADYNIFVKDIVIVNENTEQVLIDKTVSKLTVPSYTIGDANDDGMINITDVVAVISYMLKESPNPFIFKAADVNCDEMINVTDVVGIIDIMTSGASGAKPEMAMAKKAVKKSAKTGNSLEIVPFTVAAGTTSMNVALELNNPGDEFTALECKVFLPEGVDWDYTIDRRGNKIYKQPTFNEDRTDANYHTINSISKVDGGYYVIVYSDKKEIFLDEDGALLYLPLVFDENINPGVYDIRVGDIVLARPDVTQELLDDYTASVLVGSPEIASLSLNGDFTADAIAEYNTALASNTKVAAMDFSNATDVDATTAIATGNKNLLVYVAEGKSIANEDNAVIGDQCANLVLTDGHSFCAPKSFTATKASYERAASSNYGTLCLPFAPKSAASELYELTSSTESQLMFSAVASPAANTPYLYKSDTGKIAESNVEVVAEDAGNTMNGIWTMTGTYTMQTFSASDNVFALYEGKLYKNVGTLTMNPFRAYFATESSASKAEVFIETPTGIESISGSQSIGNGNMFNVQGLRVNENYKGVKIINGKKYVK